MEANKLMIGDWLSITNGVDTKYAKVCEITDKHIRLDIHVDWDTFSFKPIPLTEEILKANGFEWKYEKDAPNGSNYIFLPNTNIAFSKRCGKLETNVMFERFEMCFVHELQHALRLCGLTELADNFKLNTK